MNSPSGTVSFVSADIAGGAELQARNAPVFQEAIRRYNTIAVEIVPLHGGIVARSMGNGEALQAVLSDAHAAVEVARALLQTCLAEPWIGETPQLRISLHTGHAELYDGMYHGSAVNHGKHLLSMAHGWQALLSSAFREHLSSSLPLGMDLRDLGEYLLCDLTRPEHVFQLLYPGLPSDFPQLRSLINYPNNLPLRATQFVGREVEMKEILQLISSSRLLTLIGSAGMGKTRLAHQIGAQVLESYPDGVWLVDFASVSDASLFTQMVASILNVPEDPGKPLLHTLTAAIASQRMLLILDNCPVKSPVCSQLADTLLRTCPALQILATSRQGLGIVGETSYLVSSLSLPEDHEVVAPEGVQRSEAAQLFLDRAIAVAPNFTINTMTSSALARICRRLDGIPMALELVAVSLHSLSLDQIDSQLDACFRKQFGERQEVLLRYQTLRTAIEWSFDRLDAVQQALLCRLTIFRGGWIPEASQAVCIGDGITAEQVAEALPLLRDMALLVEQEFENSIRYDMPAAISEYCRPFLESEERITAHCYHASYYFQLAQEAGRNLEGPDANAWMEYMEREMPNFRVALTWCHEDPEFAEMGVWLAESLHQFWQRRPYPSEEKALLAHLGIALPYDASERADVLRKAGEVAFRSGDNAIALARYEQALYLYRQMEDRTSEAEILHHLGIVAREMGAHVTAKERHEHALAVHRELNDPIGEARHLHNLGGALKEQGDYEGARHHYEQAYTRNWSAGNRTAAAHNLNGLARVAAALGDRDSAYRLFTEALGIFQETNDVAWQAYNLREIVKLDLQPGLFWVDNHR